MDITSDFHSWSQGSPEHFYALAIAGKPWTAALWLLRPTLRTQAWLRKFALLGSTLQNSGCTCSRPDLGGDSKHRAHSLCFSLSPLLAPHWHCLTLHRSGELKGTEEVLSNLQNCQEEGKLSIRGWWVLW